MRTFFVLLRSGLLLRVPVDEDQGDPVCGDELAFARDGKSTCFEREAVAGYWEGEDTVDVLDMIQFNLMQATQSDPSPEKEQE